MLPLNNRLKKLRDFGVVYKLGRYVSGQVADLRFWKVDSTKFPKRNFLENDLKIGFVIGTKTEKTAVKRNRIKRQVREVIRLLLKEGKIKSGYFLIFSLKRPGVDAEYEQIKNDLTSLLKRADLLC